MPEFADVFHTCDMLAGWSEANRKALAPIVERYGEAGDAGSPELLMSVESCNQNPTVEVDETETEVRLTVTADADTDEDCMDAASVTLKELPGDRIVVDDATGSELELLP